jgi:DeoR family transcriptional regulator, L-fucose operon activator
MLVAQRFEKIIQALEEKGSIRVSELSDMCGVTEETIRRDLDQLEKKGKLRRIHGGAVSIRKEQPELPYSERVIKNVDEKRRIANEAVKHIRKKERIILDASTTAWYMAKALPNIPLTVVTNSVKVVVELSKKDQIEVISTGGILSNKTLSFYGPLAERSLQPYHVDKVFISCQGVHIPNGISEYNELQARLKEKMIHLGDEIYLLVDHSKFGVQAFTYITNWSNVHNVIVNSELSDEYKQQLYQSHVQAYFV